MKNLVITALVALGLIGFTGCMSGMMGSKCGGESKCEASGKCGDAGKTEAVDAADKCGE